MDNQGESTKEAVGSAQTDQTPQQSEASTSTKTYTQAELEKAVSDALAKQGRTHKATLSAETKKIESNLNSSMSELREENERLQKLLDDVSNDDEDKTRLTKLLRDNKREQEEIKRLRDEWEPRIAKAQEKERAYLCREIAADYEGGDAAKLARIVARTKFNDYEDAGDQIRDLADEIWTRKSAVKATVQQEPPRKIDSGVTTGITKGRKPTLEELRATEPDVAVARFNSGEWTY